MGIKAVLTSLDGVDDSIKGLYKQEGDKFHLDLEAVDEHPSVGALKRAKDHEKEARQRAENELREARTAAEKAEETHREALKSVIPKAQSDALEQSYKTKLETQKQEHEKAMGTKDAQINTLLVTSKAQALCSKISTAPDLLLPHVIKRLRAEEVDGTLQTRVLAADGTPSAATLDDLEAELLQNAAYAPIMIGSKANGGGASGKSGSGGATKKLSELSETDRLKLQRENPAEFRRLVAEAKTVR